MLRRKYWKNLQFGQKRTARKDIANDGDVTSGNKKPSAKTRTIRVPQSIPVIRKDIN